MVLYASLLLFKQEERFFESDDFLEGFFTGEFSCQLDQFVKDWLHSGEIMLEFVHCDVQSTVQNNYFKREALWNENKTK